MAIQKHLTFRFNTPADIFIGDVMEFEHSRLSLHNPYTHRAETLLDNYKDVAENEVLDISHFPIATRYNFQGFITGYHKKLKIEQHGKTFKELLIQSGIACIIGFRPSGGQYEISTPHYMVKEFKGRIDYFLEIENDEVVVSEIMLKSFIYPDIICS